jgi:Diguanylate cyclase, GGDEF domain
VVARTLKVAAAPAVVGTMDLPRRETARYMLDRLIGEWRRYGRPFAIVHLQLPAEHLGDAVPRLRTGLRDPDVLAQWDREELIVLLPETDQAGADAAAERLRDAVREIPVLAGALQWSGGSAEGLVSRAAWQAARPA